MRSQSCACHSMRPSVMKRYAPVPHIVCRAEAVIALNIYMIIYTSLLIYQQQSVCIFPREKISHEIAKRTLLYCSNRQSVQAHSCNTSPCCPPLVLIKFEFNAALLLCQQSYRHRMMTGSNSPDWLNLGQIHTVYDLERKCALLMRTG